MLEQRENTAADCLTEMKDNRIKRHDVFMCSAFYKKKRITILETKSQRPNFLLGVFKSIEWDVVERGRDAKERRR